MSLLKAITGPLQQARNSRALLLQLNVHVGVRVPNTKAPLMMMVQQQHENNRMRGFFSSSIVHVAHDDKNDVYVTISKSTDNEEKNEVVQVQKNNDDDKNKNPNIIYVETEVDDDDDMEKEEMFVDADIEVLGHDKVEWGGPRRGGRFKEPTRFGDWERKGRCTDF